MFHTHSSFPLPLFFSRPPSSLTPGMLQWSTGCSHYLCLNYWSSLIHLLHTIFQNLLLVLLFSYLRIKATFVYAGLGQHKCPCAVNTIHLPFRSRGTIALMPKSHNPDSNPWSSPTHTSSHSRALTWNRPCCLNILYTFLWSFLEEAYSFTVSLDL